MGSISQKLYPDEKCPERVTVRVLHEKKQIYPRFKELVTKKLGSDVCFVTTALWEAFLIAMDQVPPPPQNDVEIKFLRQNVQINIGCAITYQPKKARRSPISPALTLDPLVKVEKYHFLPHLLDEWKRMNEKSKQFWRERLIESGIMPKPRKKRKRSLPSVSTGKHKRKSPGRGKRMKDSMTKVAAAVRRGWKRVFGRSQDAEK